MKDRHPSGPELMAWRDGELEPAAADAVSAHVNRCATCAAEVQALDDVRALLADDPAPPLAGAWPGVAARRARREPTRRFFAWAAAAACAAGVVVGLLVGSPARTPRPAESGTWGADLPLWPGGGASLLDLFPAGDLDRRDGDA